MRTLSAAAATLAILALAASAAQAGAPIKTLPSCRDSYLFANSSTPRLGYGSALVCLINAARKAERLPALKQDARLASVADAQARKFAKTGSASHGKTLADIGKRFEKKGYRPAAYNEAFSVLTGGPSPYAFLAEMMRQRSVPCSEILDPRFRDVGIGFATDPTGTVTTLAIEFGLRRGSKQPSSDYSKSASCPHAVPPPLFDAPTVEAARRRPPPTAASSASAFTAPGRLTARSSVT